MSNIALILLLLSKILFVKGMLSFRLLPGFHAFCWAGGKLYTSLINADLLVNIQYEGGSFSALRIHLLWGAVEGASSWAKYRTPISPCGAPEGSPQ